MVQKFNRCIIRKSDKSHYGCIRNTIHNSTCSLIFTLKMKILEQLKQEADRILQQWQIQKKVAKCLPQDIKPRKAIRKNTKTIKTSPMKIDDTQSQQEDTVVETKRQTSFRVTTINDSRNPVNYITSFSINGVLVSERNELFKLRALMLIKKEDTTIILPLP